MLVATVTTSVMLVVSGATATSADPASPMHKFHQPCPAAQSLVKGTKFKRYGLAPGVSLREGTGKDRAVGGQPGAVQMHLLTIDLAKHSVRTGPLTKHLTARTPLSLLAGHRSSLVAATNTGFFDFDSGAPLGPVFGTHGPIDISTRHEPIIGITKNRRARGAKAWLAGRVTAAHHTKKLRSVNTLYPPPGLSVYTELWSTPNSSDVGVPLPAGRRHTVIRKVVHGVIKGKDRKPGTTPSEDSVIVIASSPKTEKWLSGLKPGSHLSYQAKVKTNSKSALAAGYNVGIPLIFRGGKVNKKLHCNERNSQAARTGVGITDGGKKLLILVVPEAPCVGNGCPRRSIHGLDHKEMARVMHDLGAQQAWEWDGSGSSEMIARMPKTGRLSIRNYCSDGQERPMPLGFGVYSSKR